MSGCLGICANHVVRDSPSYLVVISHLSLFSLRCASFCLRFGLRSQGFNMSEHTSILTLSRRLSPRRILCVLGAFAIFSLILMVKSKPSWSTQLPDNELSSDAEPHHQTSTSSAANSVTSGTNNIPRNSFVVASKKGDDTTWIDQHLSDWNLVRYMVDDHEAQYTVPENKGRESMVYLT